LRKEQDLVDLDLRESMKNDFHVLSVGGEIDVYTAPSLREKIEEVLGDNVTMLAIDLENVGFLDSTGLGVLVGAMKRLNERDGNLVVTCTKPHILKVFEITGLSKVFDIRDDLEKL